MSRKGGTGVGEQMGVHPKGLNRWMCLHLTVQRPWLALGGSFLA